MVVHEEALRKIAMGDQHFAERILSTDPAAIDTSGLDARTHALVRLGALVALDAAPTSYQCEASNAMASGATVEEVVGVLIAVAPTVGLARIVSAAPEVGLAIGYDVEEALEAGPEDA